MMMTIIIVISIIIIITIIITSHYIVFMLKTLMVISSCQYKFIAFFEINILDINISFYVFTTPQCRQGQYIFVLFVSLFVRIDLVTMISHEWH